MEKKDLKRLSRLELMELLLSQSRELEQTKNELAETKKQLVRERKRRAEKEYKLQNAGSIAEASLALSGVFEAAQRAADDYLEQIHKIGAQAHSTGLADVPERTTDPDSRWNPTLDITGYAKGLQLNKEKKDI